MTWIFLLVALAAFALSYVIIADKRNEIDAGLSSIDLSDKLGQAGALGLVGMVLVVLAVLVS